VKIALISVLYKILRRFLRARWGYLGRRIQICYQSFQRSKGSCHVNQIWAKISENCTYFSSVQYIETIFAHKVGLSGSANSNTLSEFSREQRELPWQPNLGKNKRKLLLFQFCTRYREFFRVTNRVFVVGELKYAI